MSRSALPAASEEKAKVYLNVLFEINSRLQLIGSIRLLNLPYGLARELCHLQMRHLCELIAIGCLTAHGDYISSAALTDQYDPSKIFKALQNSWPHFYPQAAIVDQQGNNTEIKCNVRPNALSRKQLEKIWAVTGNYLHRLNVRKFFRNDSAVQANFWPEMDAWVQQIEDLLSVHVVCIENPMSIFVAHLRDANGRPHLKIIDFTKRTEQSFTASGDTPFWST